MKTSEIITEAPILNQLKGAITSPLATAQGLVGRTQGTRRVFDTTNRVFGEWSRRVTNMSDVTDINQAIVSYADQVFQDRVAPGTSQVPPPTNLDKSQNGPMRQYLQKRAAEYWANLGTSNLATSQSQIPTGYAAPTRNTSVNIRGNNYIFNKRTGKWTDAQGKEVVIPGDIELLNQTAYSALKPGGGPATAQTTTTQPTQSARVSAKLKSQVLADVQQFIGQTQLKAVNTYLAPYIQQTGNTVRSTGVPQVDALLNILGVRTK